MNSTPMSSAHSIVQGDRKHRTGLIKMKIGYGFRVRLRDGSMVHFEVVDKSRHPKSVGNYICMHPACQGRTWKTEAEVVSGHPQQEELMRREEKHTIGFLCDQRDIDEKSKDDGWVGLLSDER